MIEIDYFRFPLWHSIVMDDFTGQGRIFVVQIVSLIQRAINVGILMNDFTCPLRENIMDKVVGIVMGDIS